MRLILDPSSVKLYISPVGSRTKPMTELVSLVSVDRSTGTQRDQAWNSLRSVYPTLRPTELPSSKEAPVSLPGLPRLRAIKQAVDDLWQSQGFFSGCKTAEGPFRKYGKSRTYWGCARMPALLAFCGAPYDRLGSKINDVTAICHSSPGAPYGNGGASSTK